MVLKDSYSYLTNEEPEMYLNIERAVEDTVLSFVKSHEEETEDFYAELVNDDYLGTSD